MNAIRHFKTYHLKKMRTAIIILAVLITSISITPDFISFASDGSNMKNINIEEAASDTVTAINDVIEYTDGFDVQVICNKIVSYLYDKYRFSK